jgi:hypothetical protein
MISLRPSIPPNRCAFPSLALITALSLSLAACDTRAFSVNLTAPVLYRAAQEFSYESDLTLARQASPAQLKTADGFLPSSPNNRLLLELLARGYLEYVFGLLEDDLESIPDDEAHHEQRVELTARATVLYDRALGYAVRDIATYDKEFPAALKKDTATFEAALKKLPPATAPALLYGGMAYASAINLNRGDIERVAQLPRALAMVHRSYELDKTLYSGGAAMTMGLAAASQPKALGGNPDEAKRYFLEAIGDSAGKFLLAKVLYARFYAVQVQDHALFESTLKEVLATPGDVMPSQRLANELAHRRAARYLKQAEDLF